MDNLVLIRVAAALSASLENAILEELRQEGAQRYRLTFRTADDRRAAVVVSLRPESPWIGRPEGRFDGLPWSPGPFAVRAKKELQGMRLTGVEKPGPDRVAVLSFAGGQALVAELATHRANLILLDADGRVVAAASLPRGSQGRLTGGALYAPPQLPAGKLIPFDAGAAAIDAFLAAKVGEGEAPLEVLRRALFGVGGAGAALVVAEAAASGVAPGAVLDRRLGDLAAGRVDPVVEAPEDPVAASERGPLDPNRFRLWPWPPGNSAAKVSYMRRRDAAETSGLFYESVERGVWAGARAEALRGILRVELRRTAEAEQRAVADRDGFENPERWRLRGEALLAGLRVAKRIGDVVVVPDPYDPDGREIAIPAVSGASLPGIADDCFRRHRRAERGRESAAARVAALAARRGRLEELADAWRGTIGDAAAVERELGAALRREGMAVGLPAGTRAQRQARASSLPRLEGVRMFTSRDGLTLYVGRSGKDNDRLTFKIAGPEDFWFHALGVPGAHVVVRNPGRLPRLPAATLGEAAAAAAWYSEAQNAAAAEVQWTRRKYVRRVPGGGGGGRVLLKRFETVRVKPAPPSGESDRR